MSKIQTLRGLVNQRLTAAAEEIFELFERTIAEYEEQLRGTKEEQHKLLDSVFNPQLHGAVFPADVQQLVKRKQDVPSERQKWSSNLDQEDPPEPPPHIKEEQEELWSSQDINKFSIIPVTVKSEDDDEEEPHSSQLYHRTSDSLDIRVCGEDFGGPDPEGGLHPEIEVKTEDCSEPETDNSEEWRERKDHLSGFKIKERKKKKSVKTHSCSWCGKTFERKQVLTQHIRIHTGEKPFSCSVCAQTFIQKGHLNHHMRIHTGEKPYSCSECGKSFIQKGHLNHHMRIHRGEKPFSCSICGRGFIQKVDLNRHMTIHTGEKPFSCSMCVKRFNKKGDLIQHIRTHTGEKPFSCPKCGKRFRQKGHFSRHMKIHTSEKPFSCSECEKSFMSKLDLKSHMVHHGGEKPYSCSGCDQRFSWYKQLKKHQCVGGTQASAPLEPISDEEWEEPGGLPSRHMTDVRFNSGEGTLSSSECKLGTEEELGLTGETV